MWQRLLYKPQKYASNYMPYTPLNYYTTSHTFHDILRFIHAISNIFIFFSIHLILNFKNIKHYMYLLHFTMLIILAFYKTEMKRIVRLSCVILLWCYLLTPVIHTLTCEINTDTIYMFFFILNLVYCVDLTKTNILNEINFDFKKCNYGKGGLSKLGKDIIVTENSNNNNPNNITSETDRLYTKNDMNCQDAEISSKCKCGLLTKNSYSQDIEEMGKFRKVFTWLKNLLYCAVSRTKRFESNRFIKTYIYNHKKHGNCTVNQETDQTIGSDIKNPNLQSNNQNLLPKLDSKNPCKILSLEDTYLNYRLKNISIVGYNCNIISSILLCSRYASKDMVFFTLWFNLIFFIGLPYISEKLRLHRNMIFNIIHVLGTLLLTWNVNMCLFLMYSCIFTVLFVASLITLIY